MPTAARREQKKPVTVFLDTSVLLAYLQEKGAAHLFDPPVVSRARYAIDPIVLQEVFLTADQRLRPELTEMIKDRVRVLSIDPEKTRDVLQRVRGLRNRIAHSNEAVVLASASDCDYLLTEDRELARLQEGKKPEILTAEQFLARVMGLP